MKNKKFIAKSFLTLAMSVSMIAAGATLAVNKTAKAADGITLSSDIQKIINDINAAGTSEYSAEYVQNHTITNAGATVSGIRVTVKTNGDIIHKQLVPNFDVNGLTKDDSLFGIVLDNDFTNTPDLYLGMGDQSGAVTYFHYNSSGQDADGAPRGRLTVRQVLSSGSWEGDLNIYTDDHGFGLSKNPYPLCLYSRYGRTAEPFNIYYDNGLNALLADKVTSATETSTVVKLLNVQPGAYADYKDPKTGNALTNSTLSNITMVEGFTNNAVSLRMRSINALDKSFIITNLAGLDLTDPNAAYTADNASLQLKDYSSQLSAHTVIAGAEAKIPEAHFASRITNAYVADFAGTVNVYGKKRASAAAEYGSYGYAYKTAEADLGAAIATGLTAGANYTFANAGDYTLEYVSDSGDKLYVDVNAIENTPKAVALTAVNASVDKQEVAIGDEITVTPSAGYTLYGFGAEAPRAKITIGTNVKYVDLVDGKFTVTADMFDGDELKLSVAAYSSKVNLTVFTKPFGEGNDSVHYTLYEGVPSTYYDGANNDGTVNVSGFKFTYGLVDGAWKMKLVNELGNFGYAVEINDGETVSKHVYKTGVAASNAFAVKGSVLITPIRLSVTAVENSAVAYLKGGNVNVSMEYKVPTVQWDNFIGAVGNCAGEIDVKGVFDKGEKPTGRPFNYANGVTFKVDLQKVTEREIGGTNYYIIRLECANLKIENVKQKYYFGISLLLNCGNGGQVLVNDPSGAFLWTEVDMKTEVEKLYAKYIKTAAPVDHHTTVTVNGTEYYSYISKASTKKLVEYYLAAQSA